MRAETSMKNPPYLQEHNAVMVTAPPQSGKTSLLQLLEKKALKSRFFSFVLYLDMAEAKGNLQQALGQFGLEWEPLLKAKGAGMLTPDHPNPPFQTPCSACLHLQLCACGIALMPHGYLCP